MIQTLYKKFYLDKPGWIDGTTMFKNIIKRHLKNNFEILDIGAGAFSAHNYKGMVRKVVGIDIRDEVLSNKSLDEACVSSVSNMPFKDEVFDLAFADYVIEHLSDPEECIKEIYRVLKPNGIFIIRTPNVFHYISIISRIVPYRAHGFFADISKDWKHNSVFKTYYRCNSIWRIKNIFKDSGFVIEELFMVEKEPSYLMRWWPTFIIGLIYERLVNSSNLFRYFRSNIFAVFRKPSNNTQHL